MTLLGPGVDGTDGAGPAGSSVEVEVVVTLRRDDRGHDSAQVCGRDPDRDYGVVELGELSLLLEAVLLDGSVDG